MFTSCSKNIITAAEVLESTLNWYKKDYQKSVAGFLDITEKAKELDDEILLQYGLFGLSSSYIMQDEGDAALARIAEIALPPFTTAHVQIQSLLSAWP